MAQTAQARIPPAAPRLVRVTLDGEALTRLSPILEADRAQAVADLEAENRFAPKGGQAARDPGPYALRLSIQEGRLVFDIRRTDDSPLTAIVLALGPFRSLIKDYQLLVDSHIMAIEEGREARIQAIDMGRRGLHNEGAQLMVERLAGKVEMDFATARRLFTLLCVLHQRI
ncbi:conserved protein of unknown function [Rhodovastum atsumiense]|uniref:UPF0262 protein F1189_00980 n=1 Tax=Rhodovastum atsumiense TaxID=504468 RepID=A0A5M6J292_9PROT|nr:UPF0262 family protein [Rhodovastum atsumiense]KAA5614733.1 UPF0262 family protein [Rhodovastum atsumiense]CAH2599728.1 conserved protein of unknown function [Rhodovastum atsumiense]